VKVAVPQWASTCFGRCDCAGILRIISGNELRATDVEIA